MPPCHPPAWRFAPAWCLPRLLFGGVSGGRNIVLTGFMGTGKTAVGRVLARRTGRELVDTDAVVAEWAVPVSEIFERLGEGEFRRLEREAALMAAGRTDLVVATGGATMLDSASRDVLAATGDVVCLTASLDAIVERVSAGGGPASRPLLAGGRPGEDLRARVKALLAERADGYARFTQVDTTGLSPSEAASAVLAAIDALPDP